MHSVPRPPLVITVSTWQEPIEGDEPPELGWALARHLAELDDSNAAQFG